MTVEFCDPPPTRSGKWWAVVDELKSRPGEWALVAKEITQTRAHGSVAQSLRRKGAEVAARRLSDNVYSVWARWPV